MIVWNKRFDGCKKRGYLDGFLVINDAHNWLKMAEYILFFTFDAKYKINFYSSKSNSSVSFASVFFTLWSKYL